MIIVVDVSEFEKYAKQLKSLHKYAYPVAVRQSLTEAAKVTKTKTLPFISGKEFENRSPNFFKANSTYQRAEGLKLHRMHSSVGMYENKLKNKSTNWAVKDLDEQEDGGQINKKTFIPMTGARSSKHGRVTPRNRFSKIKEKKFTPVDESGRFNRKTSFIRAVAYAFTKQDGYVLGHKMANGNRTLIRVDAFRGGKNFRLRYTKIYNVRKKRSVKVGATFFMLKSAQLGQKAIPKKYRNEATRLYTKHLSKGLKK